MMIVQIPNVIERLIILLPSLPSLPPLCLLLPATPLAPVFKDLRAWPPSPCLLILRPQSPPLPFSPLIRPLLHRQFHNSLWYHFFPISLISETPALTLTTATALILFRAFLLHVLPCALQLMLIKKEILLLILQLLL